METMRAFIAIKLNDQAQEAVVQAQKRLKQIDCSVKWVEPRNIHLTLKFLGQVRFDQLPAMKDALQICTHNQIPIESQLTELGAFPRPQRPKVIWVGLKDEHKKISQLAQTIDTALKPLGFTAEDRAFKSHITIGRVRTPQNLNRLADALGQYPFPAGIRQTIDRIILFKSTLTASGPIYEAMETLKFTANY